MKLFRRPERDPEPSWHLQSTARTHIGHVRSVNEDRMLDCTDHQLWAVADGMGGHSRGDRAATIVVRALAGLADETSAISSRSITSALNAANDAIFALGSPGETCGSTIAGLHVAGGLATLFWVGDSRVYRLRRGNLELLTHDHSYVQELTDAGVITAREARAHPQANVITRAVGIGPTLEIDYTVSDLAEGDMFLLCSDGLSSMVEDRLIGQLLDADIATAAARLVEQALRAGGNDNISLILLRAARQ